MEHRKKDELLMEVIDALLLSYLSDLIDYQDRSAFKEAIYKISDHSFELHDWNILIDYIGRYWDIEINTMNSIAEAKENLMKI